MTAKIDLLDWEELFILCHILPSQQSGRITVCAAQENISNNTQDEKKGRRLSRACGKRQKRQDGEMVRKIRSKRKIFFLRKMKRVVERIRGGGREDETVQSLCWCDGGLVLSWSSDGEQSMRCGHGWTTGALHECLLFLQQGKEMLMFTLTTSRLYNVNVKLHRRVQSHPPCLYTSFIYILKNTVLTGQHWHFCLFILCKKDIQGAPHRWTFKSSSGHTNSYTSCWYLKKKKKKD